MLIHHNTHEHNILKIAQTQGYYDNQVWQLRVSISSPQHALQSYHHVERLYYPYNLWCAFIEDQARNFYCKASFVERRYIVPLEKNESCTTFNHK